MTVSRRFVFSTAFCFALAVIKMVYAKDRPTIGILAQEISRVTIPEHINGASFISTPYVKQMEAAGADSIPILTEYTDAELEELFYEINGILIPGGGASLTDSQYIRNVKYFLEKAKLANDNGDYFPIWATCLGFEALMVIDTNPDILEDSDSIDIPLPLEFTHDVSGCRMFQDAPAEIMQIYANKAVTYNYHKKCVSKDAFLSSAKLMKEYKVISYNTDLQGKKFVSTIESHKYPFYGVQWHPEKITWETIPGLAIPRTDDAVLVSDYIADFFVKEASKSKHRFPSQEIKEKYLFDNYAPVYTGELGRVEESYIFD